MKKAIKAYKNQEFINSKEARELRILSEYLEPRNRFVKHNVHKTIVFYGSARLISSNDLEHRLKQARSADEIKKATNLRLMARYYDECTELAKRLVEWTKSQHPHENQFYICTGGGPGIMEAGNKGASLVDRSKSIGLNISLPFEQFPNDFISEDLNFEFHYFFTRKLWFMDLAAAMVVFPGGFGTCDELFELLTLVQTGKKNKIPIVLYGRDFWDRLINFEFMAECGLIEEEDINLFERVNTVEEAFNYLTHRL